MKKANLAPMLSVRCPGKQKGIKRGMLSKWKEVVKVKEGKINLGLNTSMCTVCMETRI